MARTNRYDVTQVRTQALERRQTFFSSWDLWEKMCFVLAASIILVCLAGFIKLRWTTRETQKHERLDEEAAATVQEIERRLPMQQQKLGTGIPFGVRALESGIEIDGIWVSKSGSRKAMPENLRQFRINYADSTTSNESRDTSLHVHSSDHHFSGSLEAQTSQSSSRNSTSPLDLLLPPDVHEIAGSHRSPRESLHSIHTDGESGFVAKQHGHSHKKNVASYKPRRSSQLRFSSVGELQHHEATLSRLEGKPLRKTTSLSAAEHDASVQETHDLSSDAVGADNERSSNSSSDSGGTLSGNAPQSSGSQGPAMIKDALFENKVGDSNRPHRRMVSEPSKTQTQTERMVVRKRARSRGISVTQRTSSIGTTTPIRESEASPDIRLPKTSRAMPEGAASATPIKTSLAPSSTEIHANKSVRKINSGFEVLPAGTFGSPSISLEMVEGEPPRHGSESRRTSKKLQKRNPSLTKANVNRDREPI